MWEWLQARTIGRMVVGGLGLSLAVAGCQSVAPSSRAPSPSASTASAGGPGSGEAGAAAENAAAADKTAPEGAFRANAQRLRGERQALQWAAWQRAREVVEVWRTVPAKAFPGLARLVAESDALAARVERDGRLFVALIEPEELTQRNPAYWRAMLETGPADPTVALYDVLLWLAKGYFDRASWELQMMEVGVPLPPTIHAVMYTLWEESMRVRNEEREHWTGWFDSVPVAERRAALAAAREFNPEAQDLMYIHFMNELRARGLPIAAMQSGEFAPSWPVAYDREPFFEQMARLNPPLAERYHPEGARRDAAQALGELGRKRAEVRSAYGERDATRLGEALETAGFDAEALRAFRRGIALRGFSLPSDAEPFWRIAPRLLSESQVDALTFGDLSAPLRLVTFFAGPEESADSRFAPLNALERRKFQRTLQETERRLTRPGLPDRERAGVLLTRFRAQLYLGQAEEAATTLAQVPAEFTQRINEARVQLALWTGRVDLLPADEDGPISLEPAAFRAIARGDWRKGSDLFAELAGGASETGGAAGADVSTERRAYRLLLAAVMARQAGAEARAGELVAETRAVGAGLPWIGRLVGEFSGESGEFTRDPDLSAIEEAGRMCEWRFYGAFAPGITPALQKARLESCVSTGVIEFVEYVLAILRLRELDPARWDPTKASAPAAPTESENGEKRDQPEKEGGGDWMRGASPRWTMPT